LNTCRIVAYTAGTSAASSAVTSPAAAAHSIGGRSPLCEKLQRHFSSGSKHHQHTVTAAVNNTSATATAAATAAATSTTAAATAAAGTAAAAGGTAAAATTAAGAVQHSVKPAELALLLDQSDLSDEPAYLAQTPTPKGDSQATNHK
jgi:hypothetical protein